MNMNPSGGQDWNPVVFSKKPTGAAATTSKNVRAAQQAGGQVDTLKKYATGGNNQTVTGTGMSARKLDDETEDFNVERVNTELKKQILQARLAKKLTQAQLAQSFHILSSQYGLSPDGMAMLYSDPEQQRPEQSQPSSDPYSGVSTGSLDDMKLGSTNQCNEKPQVIQEYESGKAIPNPQVLSKLSRVLGVPLSKKGPKPAASAKKK